MRGRSTVKSDTVDLVDAQIRRLLAELRTAGAGSDLDLATRRRLDVALRGLARDPRHARFASALYATARALRAPCRTAAS